MSYREKTNRSLKKVLLKRGCCILEVLPKEVLLYYNTKDMVLFSTFYITTQYLSSCISYFTLRTFGMLFRLDLG